MKRDWDIVRTVLDRIQNGSPHEIYEFPEHDDDVISEHFAILAEADLIEYKQLYGADHCVFTARLTWQGHEFIESAQDEGLYRKAVEMAKKSGAVSFEIIKTTIAELVKQAMFG